MVMRSADYLTFIVTRLWVLTCGAVAVRVDSRPSSLPVTRGFHTQIFNRIENDSRHNMSHTKVVMQKHLKCLFRDSLDTLRIAVSVRLSCIVGFGLRLAIVLCFMSICLV